MTYPISDVTRRVVYSGSAGVGPYSFSFEILDEGDIAVYENDTLLTITTDYTVTVNADGTGSVTLVSASTASDTIAILGNKGIERQTDFVTGGDLFASSLNDELDAQTIFAQQNAEAVSRAIKIPPQSSLSIDTTLPVPQGNYVLGWNDAGDAILNLQELGVYQGSDTTTTTAAYTNRDLVKDSSTSNVYICLQDSPAGTLLTNTSYWGLIVDAAAAGSSATAAAASATAAAASAAAAATSETNAGTSETNAGTSETNAATSASSASTSATAAASSASAASTSASNASTSETNAASSASAASTSATNAATSASAAASSATSASGSATTATTQASAASTSATNAATSETNAGTSETNAAASATAAAASAATAAAAVDLIESQYLGAQASDPSLDLNGNALTAGDWYFNTTDNLTYIYNGSSWQVTVVDTSGFVAKSGDSMTGNLSFGDLDKAIFGAGSDLEIYHDGSNSRITESGTGNLKLQADNFYVLNAAGNATSFESVAGVATLFYSNSPKLATTSTGVSVTGKAVGTLTTDNDLSFDMNASNQFKCTPTANGTLTFTNITAGQSGNIFLVNSGGYAISAAATTYISAADLSAISTAGSYFLSYFSDGTNVMVSASAAVTSAGA